MVTCAASAMENRGARLLLELAIGIVLLATFLLPRWMQRPAASVQLPPRIDHVILVVLPMGERSEAVVAEVAARGTLLRNSHALAHPALPNQIALTAGSAWGIRTESTPPIDVRHIGELLDAKHQTWGVYADDAARVPFVHFAKAPRVRSLAELVASRLPSFAYVAASKMPRLALPEHTLLIVTIEEGRDGTNDIVTAIAGEGVRAGAVSRAWYNHYSVLRTIEELLHLGTLTEHDAKADVIRDVWR